MTSPSTTTSTPTSPSPTSPSRLSHVVLRSYDVRRSIDWYVVVTDGHLIFDRDLMALMTYDEEHHRIAVMPIPHEGLGEAINDRLLRAAAPRS